MKYLSILIVIGFGLFTSCGSDTECTAESFNSETGKDFDKLSDAATAYSADQSEENCEKLKEAAENYLDTVESFSGCDELDDQQFQQALQTARDNLNNVPPCN